jgi:hypothetical protein
MSGRLGVRATSTLKASVDSRGLAQSRRVGASTGLAGDLALGGQIVTMIDASLTHALKSDSATLAFWRQAKRTTVTGVVSRRAVSGAPLVVGGGSPVIGRGSPGDWWCTGHRRWWIGRYRCGSGSDRWWSGLRQRWSGSKQ